jgi:hypothetical protein
MVYSLQYSASLVCERGLIDLPDSNLPGQQSWQQQVAGAAEVFDLAF